MRIHINFSNLDVLFSNINIKTNMIVIINVINMKRLLNNINIINGQNPEINNNKHNKNIIL